MTDLEAAQTNLAGFVRRHETNRADALAVIALFEEIEQQEKARVAKADAAFDIAKEKCDDLNGDPKQACEKDAKAVHESALKAARAK